MSSYGVALSATIQTPVHIDVETPDPDVTVIILASHHISQECRAQLPC